MSTADEYTGIPPAGRELHQLNHIQGNRKVLSSATVAARFSFLLEEPFNLTTSQVNALIYEAESEERLHEVVDWWHRSYLMQGRDSNPFALMYSALIYDYELDDYTQWGKEQAGMV